ncbi:MAG: MBL fold metallo-hydrolase, partial [Erysipelotrichaceae bacterium]|nr:MBL fold metallo-hydrolase [Erysipelotrichaceae bacterium]
DGIMFAGDTIFQGSIGRTDLPTGDLQAMMHSLQRLKQIQTDCPIYPGHGPATTLEQEKQWNPYLR